MLFSYIFRIALSAGILAFSIYQFIDGEIGNGIFLILVALLVAATIWLNEFMLLAFLAVRKGNFGRARKWLSFIKKPELMIRSQHAYHLYLNGLILSQVGEMNKADGLLKKALSTGLRLEHDRAMAKLNLAGIAATRRRKREALNWLNEAKKDDSRKMLADQIKMMKQQVSRI